MAIADADGTVRVGGAENPLSTGCAGKNPFPKGPPPARGGWQKKKKKGPPRGRGPPVPPSPPPSPAWQKRPARCCGVPACRTETTGVARP